MRAIDALREEPVYVAYFGFDQMGPGTLGHTRVFPSCIEPRATAYTVIWENGEYGKFG